MFLLKNDQILSGIKNNKLNAHAWRGLYLFDSGCLVVPSADKIKTRAIFGVGHNTT